MRFTLFVLSAVISASTAFVPQHSSIGRVQQQHFMSATMEEKDIIEKTAPSAGWEPEWDNRGNGLSPNEFMQSDMTAPDLSGMWECPLTRWDSEGYVTFVCFCYREDFRFNVVLITKRCNKNS
jgi:hypothetical protein